MKKAFFPLLLAAGLLALSACSGSDDPSQDSSLTVQVSSAAPAATATPKPTASPTPKASSTPKPTTQASAAPTPTPTPEPTQEPTPEPTPQQNTSSGSTQVWVQPNDDPTPEPTPERDPEPQANPYDYVGSDINTFYGVFGYPGGSEYGPSCMGPGEDGMLYYSNFTVYTYREGGVETIQDIG